VKTGQSIEFQGNVGVVSGLGKWECRDVPDDDPFGPPDLPPFDEFEPGGGPGAGPTSRNHPSECGTAIGVAVFALAQDAFSLTGAYLVSRAGYRTVGRIFESYLRPNMVPTGGLVRQQAQGWGLMALGYSVGGIGSGLGVRPIFEGGALAVVESLAGFVPGANFGMAVVRAVKTCK
jgi:hypothetical protein